MILGNASSTSFNNEHGSVLVALKESTGNYTKLHKVCIVQN